ncbi:MAG: threonine/serine exporter family protein [Clostridia bacterium]|nr:threonine/serine exporter family protein [Clostridia bacterium]
MMHLFSQFMLAFVATLGFAIIFRVPVRHIPACVIVGGLGWVTYLLSDYYFSSPVMGCFFGACMVGLCSIVAARVFKEAMTIFTIPGILCLVPGAKIFYTMEALLRSDVQDMAQIGIQTLMMAGAIAMGLLVMGAVIKVFFAIISKTVSIKDKL